MGINPSKKPEAQLPGRKSREDFRALFHQILHFANRGIPRIEFLQEVTGLLLDFSGADAAELRLMERNQHFRCEASRDQAQPLQFQVQPLAHDEAGEVMPSFQVHADLERLYWNILRGNFDPKSPFFTPGGSFCMEDTKLPLELPPAPGRKQVQKIVLPLQPRSLALLPIVVENKNIGLMALKSRQRSFFSREEVSFYEGLAQNLGVALTHRRAQVALRERVKELTCLYGISRLVERPGIPLEELLQGVAEILPPAWLYPGIAQACLTLNGNEYATAGYQPGVHQQTANILINGVVRGAVKVAYLEHRPDLDEGPFLKEERSLIDTIAREVALIIERRQAEEEKARLQEQLRHADRLATIGQLAAGVAHELNEPLGNILGFAQLIKKNSGLSEQVTADIDKIVKASLYAREVIRKLMLFSRQVPANKYPVNINHVVEEGLNLLESRLVKSGVEIVRSLSPNLPSVTADPTQLNQVLVNLVVNAAQAMPRGGVLTVSTAAEANSVLLTVEDTGAGMPEETVRQIFIPFFTTKDVNEGTGLGLSVVHGIVTAHGGTINVQSQIAKGSKFIIRFPAKPSDSSTEDSENALST